MRVRINRENAAAASAAVELPSARPAEGTRPAQRRTDSPGGRVARDLFVVLTLLALAYGWHLAAREEFIPDEGVGYWLGISGGTLLLLQLAYPLRKRVKFMRRTGSVPAWFRMHMMLGIAGPVLILYHCNFSFGATNSNVALVAMLLVAVSGIVGRYIYGRIHRGLYGAHLTLSDLLADATALLRDVESDVGGSGGSVAKLMSDYGARVIAPRRSLASSILHAVWTAVAAPVVRWRLLAATRAAIARNAARAGWTARDRRIHYRDARRHIAGYMQAVSKASGLAVNERLFALWHVFHMPLYCLLIVTGIVHVVAVHLY